MQETTKYSFPLRPKMTGRITKKDNRPEPRFDLWELFSKVFEIKQVQIDREKFLRKTFKEVPEDRIERLLSEGPPIVLSSEELDKAARQIIGDNRNKNALAALIIGLPPVPLPALPAPVALDLTQTAAFWMIAIQQLAYIYGEEDLRYVESDERRKRFSVYLGAMFGVEAAIAVVPIVFKGAAEMLAKKFMNTAVTKVLGGVLWKVAKTIAALLGTKLIKETVQKGILRVVPIVGGVVNGAIAYASFGPAALKLKTILEETITMTDEEIVARAHKLANVDIDAEIIDIAEEIIDVDVVESNS